MNKENINKKEITQEEIDKERKEIAEIAEELKRKGVPAGDELYMRAREVYKQRKGGELEKQLS